jgi:hypothetical protein
MECAVKRWKSLRHLDRLRAFDPKLVQTSLLAKVLGALLGDALQNPDPSFSPYGYPLGVNAQRRLALYPKNWE